MKLFRIFNRTYTESILNILTIIALTFLYLLLTGLVIYLTEIAGNVVQQAVLPTNKSSVLQQNGNPNSLSSICIEQPRQHSRKPSTVRNNIVTFFGDVPRLELFAREQTPGWCVLGNQSDKYNEQDKLAWDKDLAARPKKRVKK